MNCIQSFAEATAWHSVLLSVSLPAWSFRCNSDPTQLRLARGATSWSFGASISLATRYLVGSLVGLFYGFAFGFIVGWLLASLRNYLGYLQVVKFATFHIWPIPLNR
jgi:hypothetical protein